MMMSPIVARSRFGRADRHRQHDQHRSQPAHQLHFRAPVTTGSCARLRAEMASTGSGLRRFTSPPGAPGALETPGLIQIER